MFSYVCLQGDDSKWILKAHTVKTGSTAKPIKRERQELEPVIGGDAIVFDSDEEEVKPLRQQV